MTRQHIQRIGFVGKTPSQPFTILELEIIIYTKKTRFSCGWDQFINVAVNKINSKYHYRFLARAIDSITETYRDDGGSDRQSEYDSGRRVLESEPRRQTDVVEETRRVHDDF